MNATENILQLLINYIAELDEVQAIGISGNKFPLPRAGESDIDVFIYCDTIPMLEKRQVIINQMGNLLKESKINSFEGSDWGTGDFALINGVETWLMFFTVKETQTNIEAILKGEYPDKINNYYYPIGRCAMLKNMNILFDKNNFLGSMKIKLSEYPDSLAQVLIHYHLEKLSDLEDLQRAVSRKDVLFYHFSLDISIDHFLQALFALNKIYFPSRKRTLEFINSFEMKPQKCGEQLPEVIRLGGHADSINESYLLWCELIQELDKLTKSQ